MQRSRARRAASGVDCRKVKTDDFARLRVFEKRNVEFTLINVEGGISSMETSITFGLWDAKIHSSPEQQKRIQTAQSAKTTPTSINKETQTGCFPGSGLEVYQTTLNSCTCADFGYRGLPCKHIYRLAIECGLFPGNVKQGINKNILDRSQLTLEEAVEAIESLSEDDQCLIMGMLGDALYRNKTERTIPAEKAQSLLRCPLLEAEEPSVSSLLRRYRKKELLQCLEAKKIVGYPKSATAGALRLWCEENIDNPGDVFPKAYSFHFADVVQKVIRKVYTYLNRKFRWEIIYTSSMEEMRYPHGAQPEEVKVVVTRGEDGKIKMIQNGDPSVYYFPEDKVTELLTLYGHNRCLHGYKLSAWNQNENQKE